MKPANFPNNMVRKRKEAGERQTEHNLMAPDAKLRKLDRAPGASKKERARIEKFLRVLEPGIEEAKAKKEKKIK